MGLFCRLSATAVEAKVGAEINTTLAGSDVLLGPEPDKNPDVGHKTH